MAEQTVTRRSMCIPLPGGIDDAQAAAIANPGMSAWVSMKERARIVSGDTVLVLGATGVAGQLAIQMARDLGAQVVIDYLWGRPTELLLEALAKGSKASSTHATRLVEVGESAGKTINLPGGIL